ncbi:BON domain-containing protein [Flavobacterium agrisoli]|uniref:BON domain-containing protein n=1 Tax=Flavobacterium agrisoli TaxID=2793066 RepID=A0A934UJA9_9FLAO|nr:BON domain-containing protein [Flavobacterium agrisoli]MBK0369303.1 BON domain-containing protein [Flavobacterium agrisoli]
MKMKSIVFGISLAVLLAACGPKDADIEKEIASKMSTMPGMQVSVKDGVATIAGVCKDAACKESCEEIAKSVKGVKSVVNNCEIASFEVVAPPVEISSDEMLNTSVAAVLKSYEGVSASVNDGVITLTGEIKRDNLPGLIQSMQELKPKKVENQLTIK